jgi:hypothetical protein
VVLCPGEYTGPVFVDKDLTLTGVADPTAAKLVGSGTHRISDAVLTVEGRVNATVRNLEITRGRATGRVGGCVSNFGSLQLQGVKIHDCDNIGLGGGGILNLGGSARLVAEDSEVTLNHHLNNDGGGIKNDGGTVVLRRSHVTENTARGNGGGIHNENRGFLTVEGDTQIGGNKAQINGGGINNDTGTATIVDSRVGGNEATQRGGGIQNRNGRLVLTGRTLIERNTAENRPGSGGGVFNTFFGTVEVHNQVDISLNTPDDCVDNDGATGCPPN